MGRGGGESNHREFKYYRGGSPPGLSLPLSPESPMEPPLMRRGRDDEEDEEGKAEPPLMRRGGDAEDEPPLMRRRSDGDEEDEEAKAEPPLVRRGRDDHDDDSDDDDGGRDAEAKASGDAPRRPQPRAPSNDLFLDFDASVTEGGAPSDAAPSFSSSSSTAARATAAAAFGRYQHRRRTVEDVERDDTVVELTASPRPLPASDDEAEGGEREREAPSPRRPKPALPGGTAAEVVDKVRVVGCEERVESCALV